VRRSKEIGVKNTLGPSPQQFIPWTIEKLLIVRPDVEEGSFGVQFENDLIDGVNQPFEPRRFMLRDFSSLVATGGGGSFFSLE
jgi:hypothetical protein